MYLGTMNLFILLVNKNDELELVTPPLNGIILPGITRDSILQITREWNLFKVSEREINMEEIMEAHSENRIKEVISELSYQVV